MSITLIFLANSALEKIISRYEHRYNTIYNDNANDISLMIAELLQELLCVVREFLNLNENNEFSDALRNTLNNVELGQVVYALWTDRKKRKNTGIAIGFSDLCANSFYSLCEKIVDRVASCESIGEISSQDVSLSQFCEKYNIYSTDIVSAPLIASESIADKILGESYEIKRQQEEIIKKCVDKISSMKNEIIIDNSPQCKYKLYLRGTHEFEVYFGNRRNIDNDIVKKAVAVLENPNIIFTTDSVLANQKSILYSDIESGNRIDKVRFTEKGNNKPFDVGFDIKMININKLLELFEGLASLTGTVKKDSESGDLARDLVSRIKYLYKQKSLQKSLT